MSRISFATASGARPSEVTSAGSTGACASPAARASWARCGDPLGHVDADHLRPGGAEAQPGEQGPVRRRRQDDGIVRRQGRHRLAGGGGAKAARQRIASGFSTAGMNRSSAPMRTPSLVTARRCSLSSAASAPGRGVAGDDPAFVDQQGEQGAHGRRRGGILRGMAGGAQRRRAPLRRRCEASP